jgi:hypothetical protein
LITGKQSEKNRHNIDSRRTIREGQKLHRDEVNVVSVLL